MQRYAELHCHKKRLHACSQPEFTDVNWMQIECKLKHVESRQSRHASCLGCLGPLDSMFKTASQLRCLRASTPIFLTRALKVDFRLPTSWSKLKKPDKSDNLQCLSCLSQFSRWDHNPLGAGDAGGDVNAKVAYWFGLLMRLHLMMSLPLFRESGWCGWGNAFLKILKLLSPLEQASLSGQNSQLYASRMCLHTFFI